MLLYAEISDIQDMKPIVSAPLAVTSFTLLLCLLLISGFVQIEMTTVPSSIRAIGPCFNSPLA